MNPNNRTKGERNGNKRVPRHMKIYGKANQDRKNASKLYMGCLLYLHACFKTSVQQTNIAYVLYSWMAQPQPYARRSTIVIKGMSWESSGTEREREGKGQRKGK